MQTQFSNLCRYKKLVIVFDWIKWASTPKYCTALHEHINLIKHYVFWHAMIYQGWHEIIISRILPHSMNMPAQQYIQISMLGLIEQG
jgi:hypothetical protein